MYQAIVFLPLLGAILAALISLVGARARHPGGSPGDMRTLRPPRMLPRMMNRRTCTARRRIRRPAWAHAWRG